MSEIINIPQPLNRDLYLNDVTQATITGLTTSINSINKSDRNIEVLAKLSGFTYNPQPIKLYIDSYGGDAYACYGFINTMKVSATPIHTIVTGCAMSCGFIIASQGHKRFSHKLSTFMYHQISFASWGKIESIKEDLTEAQRLQDILYNVLSNTTKLPKKKLLEIDKGRIDWYMTSNEALSFKVIDEIIE